MLTVDDELFSRYFCAALSSLTILDPADPELLEKSKSRAAQMMTAHRSAMVNIKDTRLTCTAGGCPGSRCLDCPVEPK